MRFETEPGEQAQVDYGQLQVWIGEQPETFHLFVFTLGYSRRLFTRRYRNEKLATLLDGHERAFRHFGRRDAQLPVRQSTHLGAGPQRAPSAVASAVRGLRALSRLHPAHLPTVPARTKGKVESWVKSGLQRSCLNAPIINGK